MNTRQVQSESDNSIIYRLISLKPERLANLTSQEKKEVLFTRNSTGLVRQGKWIDSFIFNSSSSWMFGSLIFALSSFVFFDGADLISAEGIALIFAIAIAAMYAILTSMMPRSGGDYIFNSRIVHPVFGFSFNFSLTVWQLFQQLSLCILLQMWHSVQGCKCWAITPIRWGSYRLALGWRFLSIL